MKKILYIALAFVSVLLTGSCQRDLVQFEYEKDCAGAFFKSASKKYLMVPEDGNKIIVEMMRGNIKGDMSVPFEMDDYTDGIFVPEKKTFDFKDGENTATVVFNYPDIYDFLGEKYQFDLTIDPAQTSMTASDAVSVTAQRKLTNISLGTGTFVDAILYQDMWEQDICNTEEAFSFFVLPDCFTKGSDITFTAEDGVFTCDEAIDLGVEYSSSYPEYGNFFITNALIGYSVDPDTGAKALLIAGTLSLPAIEYDLCPYVGTFILPEDFDAEYYFGVQEAK